MHRQRTQLTRRVNRVATSVERRGIAATYALHDRLLSNRLARHRFTDAPPCLDAQQREIVEALHRDGYVALPFVELMHDQALCNDVQEMGDAFIARTEAALRDGSRLKVRAGKEYVARRYSFEGATVGVDDPWFRAVSSRRLLDIANAYLRLWSKLSYVDLWFTVPQRPDEPRTASQNWHFDFDDRHLLKAFVYLVDVDADMGPFEFVPGSQPGGRYHAVRPWTPMGYGRVSDEDVARGVAPEDIVSFTAPRGTLLLCNTSGLHRGGYSTSHPRVLATATYCSPASLASLSRRNFTPAVDLEALDDVTRFALT
jgi:hypothetical protein